MKTSTLIELYLLEKEINQDATFSSSSKQVFADLSRLSTFDRTDYKISTLELNLNPANGQMFVNDDLSHVAFMSFLQSDNNCIFTDTYVECNFSNFQTFHNMTFVFGYKHPKKISITYYKNSRIINSEFIDNIKDNLFYTQTYVKDVTKVVLTFLESEFPRSYAYLQSWIFGAYIVLDDRSIENVAVSESVEPISTELPADTLTFDICNDIYNFDFFDPNSMNNYISYNKKCNLTVKLDYDDGTFKEINFGEFYIDETKLTSEKVLSVKCKNVIGYMDDFKYDTSPVIHEAMEPLIPPQSLLIMIFAKCGINQTELSFDFDNSRVIYGYLPEMSCREALQHVCFALSLAVVCNRGDKIVITQLKRDPNKAINYIDDENIFLPVEFEKTDSIRGIKYTFNKIYKADPPPAYEEIQLVGMDPEREVVYMSTPSYDYKIEIGTIVDESPSRVIIEDIAAGESVLKYRKYVIESYTNIVESDEVVGKVINIPTLNVYEEFFEFSSTGMLESIYNYYSKNNVKAYVEYICEGQNAGSFVDFELQSGKTFKGIITHQNIEISKGMLTQSEIMGSDL